MTRRERIIAALNHVETDIIPYEIGFTHQEYEKVAAYLGDSDFIRNIGNHMDAVYYSGIFTEDQKRPVILQMILGLSGTEMEQTRI
jgi:uroporphyrinogen decarboxylase